MTGWKLRLYHNAPPLFRDFIASARGYQLRAWRYGQETDSLVEAYAERETWNAEQWRKWEEEKLAFLLHRAATKVPYYREQWNQRRQRGEKASWEYLENWQVLPKEAVRTAPRQFIAEDCDLRSMYHEHTSGTTGKSLDLWWSHATVKHWYALFETRCRLWHGVSRHDRWAILGGQLVTPVAQRHPPFWVWNAGLHQLYMSSYHLAPDLIPHYLNALKKYNIRYLWGYTSSLYMLAVEALRLHRNDIQMQVVLTNAEPLYEYQRKTIEAAFQCPVRETYGMAEIVAAASECPRGKLHIWREVGIIEVMEEDLPVLAGSTGELVCTGLFNMDMPLIRYQVGDRGSLTPDAECPCGRTLPLLHSLEGRADDILYTADGRLIGRLDPVFKSRLPIIEAQIIQEEYDKIIVRYVPAPEYQPADGQSIIKRLKERLGNVEVILESVPQLPVEKNGKFRAVISKLKRPNKVTT
jgi:phenylacetate-CoA ligase